MSKLWDDLKDNMKDWSVTAVEKADWATFPLPNDVEAGPNKATVSAQLVRNIVKIKLIKIFFKFPSFFN